MMIKRPKKLTFLLKKHLTDLLRRRKSCKKPKLSRRPHRSSKAQHSPSKTTSETQTSSTLNTLRQFTTLKEAKRQALQRMRSLMKLMRKVISMPLVFLGDRAKSLDNFKIMKMKDKNIMNILKTKDLTSRMLHSTIFQPHSMELDKINLKTNSLLTSIKKK